MVFMEVIVYLNVLEVKLESTYLFAFFLRVIIIFFYINYLKPITLINIYCSLVDICHTKIACYNFIVTIDELLNYFVYIFFIFM